MPYKKNDYIYVISFEFVNRIGNCNYTNKFMNCWCKVVDYDPETNTYDVMTEYKSRFHKVPEHAIYDKRTKQQGHKIRIKKLEI